MNYLLNECFNYISLNINRVNKQRLFIFEKKLNRNASEKNKDEINHWKKHKNNLLLITITHGSTQA
jgi:hypothetical protein